MFYSGTVFHCTSPGNLLLICAPTAHRRAPHCPGAQRARPGAASQTGRSRGAEAPCRVGPGTLGRTRAGLGGCAEPPGCVHVETRAAFRLGNIVRIFPLTDLLTIILYWKVIGDKYFVVHHCTSLYAFFLILVSAGVHSTQRAGRWRGRWGT